MVVCYQNCSDLLWEKNVLVIEKIFRNSRLKVKNLQNFWDHYNNLFKWWNVWTIFGNRMLYFLEWETSRNKLKNHSLTKNCSNLSVTVWINCCSDLKNFANFWPSASNFKSFSQSLEHFFLTVGQNNSDNKIPFKKKYISNHLTIPVVVVLLVLVHPDLG